MSRLIILVAIALLSIASLAAEDGIKPFGDRKESTAAHATFSDIESIRAGVDVFDDVAPTPVMSFSDLESDQEYSNSTEGCQNAFHPVCVCGCRLGYLDPWGECECQTTCCTTDEWCCNPCQCSHGNCYRTEGGSWVCNDSCCDVWGDRRGSDGPAVRFGWWGVDSQGSQLKTGEFQDLRSSPFWDVDGISSDGERTLDFTLSGLDNEANNVRALYYGPDGSAKVRYNRFLRRQDHDPLTGVDRAGPLGPNDNVVSEDLNLGEDYAIRVQQFDAKFQGHLTENIKWRVNMWGQRKFGERQTNATAHCFNIDAPAAAGPNSNVCHVLSQRQNIDWLTMEIQPVVEAQFGIVTMEYSRTMRGFGQDDQTLSRQYTRFGFSPASGALGPEFDHAIAPENFTQIDRLKVSVPLTQNSDFYGNAYTGDTENTFRDTHRQYHGFDLRLINRSIEKTTWTGYASMYDENNQLPPFFFNAPPLAPANNYDQDSLRHPVDYNRSRVGLKGNWRDPGSGWSMTSGYEYFVLARDFANYDTALGPFVQQDTKSHLVEIGPSRRWSSSLNSYLRYKVRFSEDPLIGVREANGRFNSNQPELEHRVEIGGNWTPAENLMATAQFSVVNRSQRSEFANFSEDDYPFVTSLLYAPTDRLSLTGGYAYFSNWIDQDITLGFTTPGVAVPPVRTETTPWSYAGQNHVISLNAAYAWSPNVQLTGGYEWNHGTNLFSLPPSPAGADWTLLPSLSDVNVETQRYSAGVDWQPQYNMVVFCRYNYFDYADNSGNVGSGTAHMALAGASVIW